MTKETMWKQFTGLWEITDVSHCWRYSLSQGKPIKFVLIWHRPAIRCQGTENTDFPELREILPGSRGFVIRCFMPGN